LAPDVTLVNGSVPFYGAPDFSMPLGVLYLAAALEEAGFSTEVRDYQLTGAADPLDPEAFADFLDGSADVVGISCMSYFLPFLMRGLEKLKERHPQKTVILGGSGPTGVAEDLLNAFGGFEAVVRGEGELTVVELMERLQAGKGLDGVKGVSFRKEGGAVSNPSRERIRDMDALPLPAFKKLDLGRYGNGAVITARGCPYNCTFCDVAPLWGRRTYSRSVESIIEEMSVLKELGKDIIDIHDDTFVLSKKRVLEFCDTLDKEGLDVGWSSLGRVNLMDDELMGSMAKHGCLGVFYGIESGSDAVLKRIKKRFTADQAMDVLAKSAKYFAVKSSFIYGFPFETMQDFFDTLMMIAFSAKLGQLYQVNFIAPLPLSDLYLEYKHELQLSPQWMSSMTQSGYVTWTGEGPRPHDEILEMVGSHPDIFPGFYHIPSPELPMKRAILAKLGMNNMTFEL